MNGSNPEPPRETLGQKTRHHLRSTLFVGLLIMFPFAITYVVLHWVFNAIDGILQPIFHTTLGWSIPGLGLLAIIVLVYILGLIWNNLRIGRRIIQTGQHYLLNIPVVGAIYGPARQLIESFGGNRAAGFKRVVVVEYPKEGAWMIGFLTGLSKMTPGEMMGVVYLPTAPTPNSGWVAIIPVKQIYDTTLTVQQAMTMVLSGGISSPLQIDLHIIDPREAIAYVQQGSADNPNEVSGAYRIPFLGRGSSDNRDQ
jgi:uncharacterized membrane protein